MGHVLRDLWMVPAAGVALAALVGLAYALLLGGVRVADWWHAWRQRHG